MQNSPHYYSTILEERGEIETTFVRQIDRDLYRTLPEEKFAHDPEMV